MPVGADAGVMRDPAALAVALMAVESTSGAEGEVVALAERLLAGDGWATTRIPVTAGRDALFARVAGDDRPCVTLSTHLDTVPPYIAPRRAGGRLHGRGACDAKGIAAAMIVAAGRLRERGLPVALLLVVGEETAHDGAHAADAWAAAGHVRSIALVNGEPTESTLALGTKGAMRAVLTTRGRMAHSAYPHLGESATMKLVRLLAELDALALPHDALLGPTTVNVGSLAGGVADNVMAPSASARLMVRLVTPMEETLAVMRRWVGDRAELEAGITVPPVRLGALPGFATSIAAFATDIPALPHWGTPYLYGPGSIHVAHTDDEFVDEAELAAAVTAYEGIVAGVLAQS